MIEKSLFEPTLKAGHFKEIGMPAAKLRVWTEETGIGSEGREKGKWKLFSPADALGLSSLKALKDRSGLVVKEQGALIAYLRQPTFTLECFNLWRQQSIPHLITDLRDDHRIARGTFSGARPPNPFFCSLSLETCLVFVSEAIRSSGNDVQKLFIRMLDNSRLEPGVLIEKPEEKHLHIRRS